MTTSPSTSANQDRLTTLLTHTAQRSRQRCCFLLRVRPERLTEYIEVHQHVWQDMRDALSNAGWRRYSLFLRPEDGLVVGYFQSDATAISASRSPSTVNSPSFAARRCVCKMVCVSRMRGFAALVMLCMFFIAINEPDESMDSSGSISFTGSPSPR